MRIAVGQMSCESNTFATFRCDLETVRNTGYVYNGPPVVAYDDAEVVLPPARVYPGAPVYAQDPRLYRHCWWEWGERRCAVRRGW